MDLMACLNRYYYDMTVTELRMLNRDPGAKLSHHSAMYLELIDWQENCTVSSLSETLHISKPAVTKKVNDLLQRGLVVKTQSQSDKRVFYLRVSAAISKANELYDRPYEHAVHVLEQAYSEEELSAFCRILDRFSAEYMKEAKP